jgi:hypothetical protein
MPVTEGINATTVLKASPGRIKSVSVIVAGAAGTINDCTTTGAVANSNAVAGTPAAIGNQVWATPLNCGVGIVAAPGAGQTVTVDWE